jgi:hypothetical protein
MRTTQTLPKVKEKLLVIVQTISPFGNNQKGFFYLNQVTSKQLN